MDNSNIVNSSSTINSKVAESKDSSNKVAESKDSNPNTDLKKERTVEETELKIAIEDATQKATLLERVRVTDLLELRSSFPSQATRIDEAIKGTEKSQDIAIEIALADKALDNTKKEVVIQATGGIGELNPTPIVETPEVEKDQEDIHAMGRIANGYGKEQVNA